MKEIFNNAFTLTKKHALILIGAILSLFVISMIFSFITAAFANVPVINVVANLASLAFQLYLGVVLIKLVLCLIDGKEPEFSDIKPTFLEVMKYFTSGVLVALIFMVVFMITLFLMSAIGVINTNISGMLSDIFLNKENVVKYSSKEIAYGFGVLFLMAIPAFLLYLRLQFANYIVIDKENETAFTAVMRSANITKGYLFYIVLTVFVIILLNIIGLLLLFVGLLFTIPMSFVMLVLLYRSLEQNYEADLIEQSTQQ
jgi:hypothetical protein